MIMKFRVSHFPQIPCKPFTVDCGSYEEAHKVSDSLCEYDLFLLDNNHRCDYANMSCIKYWDEKENEWLDYDPLEWEGVDNNR